MLLLLKKIVSNTIVKKKCINNRPHSHHQKLTCNSGQFTPHEKILSGRMVTEYLNNQMRIIVLFVIVYFLNVWNELEVLMGK